jgi:hypothetical protein
MYQLSVPSSGAVQSKAGRNTISGCYAWIDYFISSQLSRFRAQQQLLDPNPANAVALAPSSSQSAVVFLQANPIKEKEKKPVEPACRCRVSIPQLSYFEPPQNSVHLHPFSVDHLGDLVHVGIVADGWGSLGGGRGSGAAGLVTTEVVLHLSIELFGSLGLRLASATSLLLVGTCLSSTSSTVGSTLLSLDSALGLLLGGGLGLAVKDVSGLANSFWRYAVNLRNAVAEALCNASSRNALGAHDNFDLVLVSKCHEFGHVGVQTFIARLSTLTPFSSCAAWEALPGLVKIMVAVPRLRPVGP